MPDFVSHVCLQYFPFCTFVTMICLTSAEVLNLVARLDSAVLSLDFEQINIFLTKTSGFDTVSILFDSLSVGRRSPEFLAFDLGVPSSDLE